MKFLLVGITTATVLGVHSGAFAQQEAGGGAGAPTAPSGAPAGPAEAAPPQAAPPQGPPPPPPPYAPPPGYGAQPGYGNQPGQYRPYQSYYYPPPPPPAATFRPFTIGLGLGMGPLTQTVDEDTQRESGISYSVRLGFGLTRQWLLLLALEGMTFDAELQGGGDEAISHRHWMMGVQFFPLERLYLRAGFGLATVSEEIRTDESDKGPAFFGGVGFEFVQTHNVALALEWASSVSNIRNRALSQDNRETSRTYNRLPKVVVSDTLEVPEDNAWSSTTTVVPRASIAGELNRLRTGGDGDVLVFGSHVLWNALLAAGLVDELHLMVSPNALGSGIPLLTGPAQLALLGTRTFDGSDNVLLRYAAR